MVGDKICKVKRASRTKIVCKVKPWEETDDIAFIGGRGLRRIQWNSLPQESVDWYDLPVSDSQSHQTEVYSAGAASGDFVAVYKGLFKAPANGEYRFLLSASGNAEFHIAYEEPFDTQILNYELESVVNASNTPKNDPYFLNTISDVVELEQDEYYYYELRHLE